MAFGLHHHAPRRRIPILGSLDKAAHEPRPLPEIIAYGHRASASRCAAHWPPDPRRIAINFSIDDELADGLSYGMYLLLQKTLHGIPYGERLVSSEGIVSRLRSRKLEPELARITRACEETVDLFAQLHKRLKPGMTEKEIAP
jgi:Xaa-Pro aminopeptidase